MLGYAKNGYANAKTPPIPKALSANAHNLAAYHTYYTFRDTSQHSVLRVQTILVVDEGTRKKGENHVKECRSIPPPLLVFARVSRSLTCSQLFALQCPMLISMART